MAKVKVYNTKAEVVGQLSLNDDVFGCEYNEPLIHQVIVAMNNNKRQGTKSALTRSEVRGHAKKPWRQKGTGRARQGSTKGPQWRGGGIVFAPKPRDFSKKVNKEARKVAFRSAISAKLQAKEILVLQNLELKDAKTKSFVELLSNLKIDRTAIFVTKDINENLLRSSNNVSTIDVTTAGQLNVYDIICCDKLVLTEEAIKAIEEAYVG